MAKRHVALTRKMVEEAIYIDIEKRINDEIPALIGEFSDPSAQSVKQRYQIIWHFDGMEGLRKKRRLSVSIPAPMTTNCSSATSYCLPSQISLFCAF